MCDATDSAAATVHAPDAGAPGKCEIEVTPEMIEAGFKVLKEAGLTDDLLEADRLTVSEIYRAMNLSLIARNP